MQKFKPNNVFIILENLRLSVNTSNVNDVKQLGKESKGDAYNIINDSEALSYRQNQPHESFYNVASYSSPSLT